MKIIERTVDNKNYLFFVPKELNVVSLGNAELTLKSWVVYDSTYGCIIKSTINLPQALLAYVQTVKDNLIN